MCSVDALVDVDGVSSSHCPMDGRMVLLTTLLWEPFQQAQAGRPHTIQSTVCKYNLIQHQVTIKYTVDVFQQAGGLGNHHHNCDRMFPTPPEVP